MCLDDEENDFEEGITNDFDEEDEVRGPACVAVEDVANKCNGPRISDAEGEIYVNLGLRRIVDMLECCCCCCTRRADKRASS